MDFARGKRSEREGNKGPTVGGGVVHIRDVNTYVVTTLLDENNGGDKRAPLSLLFRVLNFENDYANFGFVRDRFC